jgi:hypothetical protein
MKRPVPHTELLITPDRDTSVVYLAMVYTDYRAWYSHFASTPFANQRQRELADFFQTGALPPGWHGRTIFVILPHDDPHDYRGNPASPVVYENDDYRVRMIRVP